MECMLYRMTARPISHGTLAAAAMMSRFTTSALICVCVVPCAIIATVNSIQRDLER